MKKFLKRRFAPIAVIGLGALTLGVPAALASSYYTEPTVAQASQQALGLYNATICEYSGPYGVEPGYQVSCLGAATVNYCVGARYLPAAPGNSGDDARNCNTSDGVEYEKNGIIHEGSCSEEISVALENGQLASPNPNISESCTWYG